MKLTNFYTREIETKPRVKLALHGVILLVNLILVGYYGTYLGVDAARRKYQAVNLVHDLTVNLQQQINTAEDLQLYINSDAGVVRLDQAVPTAFDYPVYLRQLIIEVSKKLKIMSITQVSVKPNRGEVVLKFGGPITDATSVSYYNDLLVQLIPQIENQSSLTRLASVSADTSGDVYTATLVVYYYFYTQKDL